jgi:glycosyltransferase involved in cell wall biosynthesis
MPLSVIEAMAAGLPIVGSDVEGVKEIIGNGHDGLLVRPGQADELGKKIIYLAEARGDILVARHDSFCPSSSL